MGTSGAAFDAHKVGTGAKPSILICEKFDHRSLSNVVFSPRATLSSCRTTKGTVDVRPDRLPLDRCHRGGGALRASRTAVGLHAACPVGPPPPCLGGAWCAALRPRSQRRAHYTRGAGLRRGRRARDRRGAGRGREHPGRPRPARPARPHRHDQVSAYQVLVPVLEGFRRIHPRARLRLVEGTTASLERDLEQKAVDVAFLHPPLHTPGLSELVMTRTPLMRFDAVPDQPFHRPLVRYPGPRRWCS